MVAVRRLALAAMCALVVAAAWTGAASAGVYVVDRTDDPVSGTSCGPVPTGSCSLRAAISAANANPGSVIQFRIGTGNATIAPTSPLPTIVSPTTIDGRTQPYWSPGQPPMIQLDGGSAGNGANGFYITGGGTTVRGLSIVGFDFDGIRIETGDNNVIVGNWLGVNLGGGAQGNHGYGIDIRFSSAGNTVGGANRDDRNVISANGFGGSVPGPYSGLGVFEPGTEGSVIIGNYIGTDTAGGSASGFGNAHSGVLLRHTDGQLGQPGAGNVISGNSLNVELDGTSATVQGNKIGTDKDGLNPLFDSVGVLVSGSPSGNLIGGITNDAGNLIGGNTDAIELQAANNAIKGNRIGVDVNDDPLSTDLGVRVDIPADDNVIGREPGDPPDAGNVIANADDAGVLINGANGTQVLGNDMPENNLSGIRILSGNGSELRDNTITDTSGESGIQIVGGTGTQVTGNRVTGSGEAALDIRGSSTQVTVSQNSIADNSGLGIDLENDGVTPNDPPPDSDTGPNGLQNYPVITQAVDQNDGTIDVSGTLDTAPDMTLPGYTIEFFESKSCRNVNPQGDHYVGTLTNVTTDAGGHANWLFTIPGDGGRITVTVTDEAGNTSEFSQCAGVTGAEFVVDDAGDASGGACTAAPSDCTLRSAIENANSNPVDMNVISFSVGIGSVTITPATPLPDLTGPVVIDGRTQPGFTGVPIVELDGSAIVGGPTGLSLADDSTVRGLLIANWGGSGIAANGTNTTIQGNYVGVDEFGLTHPNGTGVLVRSAATTQIGGASAAARNVISANNIGIGIDANSADTTISGNYVGTDADGLNAFPNDYGIIVDWSTGTVIGGTTAAERNVISGNAFVGILTQEGVGLPSGVEIKGNYIGIDALGTSSLGNGNYGVRFDTGGTTVGGTTRAARNVISGNGAAGIAINDSGNSIFGNYIGTTPSGMEALANAGSGVLVNADGATVGGSGAGEGNLISGNPTGIFVSSFASATAIDGNLIGTNATGRRVVPNEKGISILSSPDNTIGVGARNVISGNNALGGGAGIEINGAGATGTVIKGNYIGTDSFGTSALSPTQIGVSMGTGADNTTVGGTDAASRNVISGNNYGVWIGQVTGAKVQGNYIGTDKNGLRDVGNTASGVLDAGDGNLIGGTAGTTPGGPCTGACNVVSGNDNAGIDLQFTDATVVQGNYVGVGADGVTAIPNHIPSGQGIGISLTDSTNVQIGGTTASARNVVGNNDTGILVFDASNGAVIQGNYVGLAADSSDAGNRLTGNPLDGMGIDVVGSNAVQIGGATAAAGNVISGNEAHGIHLKGADATTIQGNVIGTNPAGTAAIPNGGDGISVEDQGATTSGGTTIGGSVAATGDAPGNLISGNGSDGIALDTLGTGNVIQGNLIGTNRAGTAAIGNGQEGIRVEDFGGTSIGGSTSATRNVTSGNGGSGILLTGTQAVVVRGNYSGTNITGTAAVPNGFDGIGDNGNFVGGANVIRDNVVSGNTLNGVALFNQTSDDLVQGNMIGTAADGTTPLGNGAEGVRAFNITGAKIGGATAALANTIANSGIEGVHIFGVASTGVDLQRNSIYGNGGLGINLFNDGVTANDYFPADCAGAPDCDTGPNELQNFPDLTSAQLITGATQVTGSLDSRPGRSYRIDFYRSAGCDPSGNGEGRDWIGFGTYSADGSGHVDIDTGSGLTVPGVSAGDVVTATATDTSTGSTSEFSGCVTVTAAISASISLASPPRTSAGAQDVAIGDIELSGLTQATATTQGAPLDGIPLDGIDLTKSPLDGIPLDGIGFTPTLLRSALGGVHLSDIPLQTTGGWTALLANTSVAGLPLNTITLADALSVLPTTTIHNITLGQIDLSASPLDGIALGALALGPLTLDDVNLNWCSYLDAPPNGVDPLPGYACPAQATTGDIVIDPSTETFIGATVKGLPLDGIPLDGIPLDGIPLDGIPLDGIPLDGIDLSGTPLDGIPLDGIPLDGIPLDGIPLDGIAITGSPLDGIPLDGIPLDGISTVVDCSNNYCTTSGHTLGTAQADGRLLPGATLAGFLKLLTTAQLHNMTLGGLVDALTNSGLSLSDLAKSLAVWLPNTTLHDILAVLLGSTGYDWSQLNLTSIPLADFASVGGVVTLSATFQVTGGGALSRAVTIQATLPQGGLYVPGTTKLDGNAFADPNVGATALTWSMVALVGQTYTLQWNVRPGLTLGTSPINANIVVNGLPSAVLAAPVQLDVGQTFDSTPATPDDTNNDPSTAPILAGGHLYVSHLIRADTDYFRIPIPTAYGSRVELTLSHIATGSDYDLAASGPEAPRLRSAPLDGIPLTNTQLPDTNVELAQTAQSLQPETLQDVPLDGITIGGNTIRGVSDNRGNADEHITLISTGESGYYTVQISDYAGDSPSPYVLEVETAGPPNLGVCNARTGINNAASGPALTSVPAATNTIFLVNQRRLEATFPGQVTALMSKVNALAGRTDLGITGAVVPVENGPGVAAAYSAWDAQNGPCSPGLANGVVRAIGQYLDTLETGRDIKYVVLVGGDDIIPFARVPDETQIANERGYAASLGATNNEYLGSLGSGFLLTDDVYSQRGAREFLGHELFLPQQATGRLVESPADITKTIDNFTGASGLLSPTSSLVTGYDFLSDGAVSINAPFAAGFGTQAKTLISETWDRGQLLAALFPAAPAVPPTLSSINAHFDHNRLLPAAQNNTRPDPAQLVTTTDVTSRGGTTMAGRLGFSIGCHSGLAVSDAIFGAANILRNDWAQAMLGTSAAGWIGNTGYGLGDTSDVAYSERLHALFARKLDGSLPLGQALAQAKQDYIGTLGVISPYDAKVVMQTTLYGLPMLRLGAGIPPVPPPPLPLHTDPSTGLQAAAFDALPTFTPKTTPDGSKYYTANDGIQSTPRRPLEPLYSLDVTQPGAAVAHGAMLRTLNNAPPTPPPDETNFNAAFSRVTTDQAADEFDLVGVTAFPSKIQNISTYNSLGALRQRLNLIVGLFRSNGPTLQGIGTHRLYTHLSGDVFYSTSSDWTPPTLGELDSFAVSPGIVGFAVDVTDVAPGVVKAVNLIYRDCAGIWRTSNFAPSGNRWSGGGAVSPSTCTTVDYYLQAVDSAGNVAVSSKKIQLEPLVLPASSPDITGTATGTQAPSGWYTGNVTVTLDAQGDPIEYSLDGGPFQPYSAPFQVTTDGIHTVDGRTPSGETRHLAFGIDKTAPTIVINTPLNGATYALGQQVRADYACIDAGSGIASGCVGTVANGALIDTSTLGSKTFTVSAATDNVGKVAPQKQVTYTVGYRKILFASTRDGNSEIYSMNLNGTNVTRLTNNPAEDASPVYSRDGRRILFTSTRTGNGDIYAMNPDGSGVVRLTSSTGVEALGDFSPDGSKIVFTSTKDGNAELYVMNADGTGQTRLTNNSAADADPVFSPSGTEIAWSSNRTSSTHDIYTATFNPLTNALGTATQRTTAAAPDTEPAWSTAGIAFVSQRDGNTEIYTMTPTGGSQTRRTTNTANDLSPAWSVDGTQILFASNRQGSRGFDIWSMTATGGSQTNRTTAAGSDTQPAW